MIRGRELSNLNISEYSVSEVSLAIKRTVESNFEVVRIRGEVGRISRPASGHIYLDLKDDKSVIAGVIWKGNAQKLQTIPEEGLEIITTGRVTTFPGQSKYQIIIERVEHAGVGALMALLEKRKQSLFKEGIFNQDKKKKIPFIPRKIGVITSESGAVIQDILQRVNERFPVSIVLWPVSVQGAKSADQISAAIKGFNQVPRSNLQIRPDVIIVARGGGSVEDLWSFNEDKVVRAVYESHIPIISAVGHETDNTLIDLAADLRAATPTAAAELAVPVRSDLITMILELEARKWRAKNKFFQLLLEKLSNTFRRLPKEETLFDMPNQYLDDFSRRIIGSIKLLHSKKKLLFRSIGVEKLNFELLRQNIVAKKEALAAISLRINHYIDNEQKRKKENLYTLARVLETLSYRNTLNRGYSLVLSTDGALVNCKAQASIREDLTIEFRDGKMDVKIK